MRRLLLTLAILLTPCIAFGDVDVTGRWQSTYNFGEVEEVMTAEFQQIGESIIVSCLVEITRSADRYAPSYLGRRSGAMNALYLHI
mgnify:CR=1 FL=1